MIKSNFKWTEEYCKAVKHYLSTAARHSGSNRLKKGEVNRIASTLGIDRKVLLNGINAKTILNKYLQTDIYVNERAWSEEEIRILVSFVLESADNLQHAFRSTALYFRATSNNNVSVNAITIYYYTHLKPGDLLFNIISTNTTFSKNVKNNIAKGQSTIGVR